ncbi:MAG TPA: two-component regulator propeller domain-containing protein, partial [Bacteroidales bacterium]|nr:two-component regulator propeller domain-containing protein [Bacteroidales bacterium]
MSGSKQNINSLLKRLKRVCAGVAAILFLLLSQSFLTESHAEGISTILSFDNFYQSDGLPNNQIQCIYQDSKGWIWLGTSHGLSRFDGYRFVNF